MHDTTFLQDLAVVMIVAGAVTVLFHQLKQPVVLGYILAGVIIGPHFPPAGLIADEQTIQTLSELGVIFLMFSLGLEFSLGKLKKVGATAFIASTLAILLMSSAGFQVGRLFGWSQLDSVFLGAILSISSTAIVVKALDELGKTKERFAELIFGILIVEDILAIVMIALLSGFATTGSLEPAEIGRTVLKLSAFLGVLFVVGLIAVPRLLNYVARFKSNEMLLVTVVGLCFGVSLLAVKLGYSVALGAFLIGAIIAEARQIAKIEALTHPVRDLFSAVFFVSIGLLIDPALLLHYWVPVLVISAVVVIGQVLSCSLGTFVAGHDLRTSLRVGLGLAQIGEFSFIIAALGLSLKVTSDFLYPIAVAVSVVTTLVNPYLLRNSDRFIGWFDRKAPASFVGALGAYTHWVSTLAGRQSDTLGRKLVRQWSWQIALNLLLIAAVFIVAVWLRWRAPVWLPAPPGGVEGLKATLWLGAMIISLPMLIATVRKIGALGILLGEMSVSHEAGGEDTAIFRAIVAKTILAAACGALFLIVLLLSSAILPSRNVLILAALVVAITAIVLRRPLVRLYAKAQIALRETFATPADPLPHERALAALPALRDAELTMVQIEADSPAVGALLGELRLRTQTGASVVGIERAGSNIINPGADEDLRLGDRVLLLGTAAQFDATRLLLQATAKS